MKTRFARGFSLAIAVGLTLSGGAALAAESVPAESVDWELGEEAPFAGTRFDGALVDNKLYFLGFRLVDNTTDGSIWFYNVKTDKYVDTGVDMEVPVSNYTVAVLEDKTGLGLYTFGGRNGDGETIDTVQVFYPDTETTKVIKSDPWPGTTPSDCTSLPATGVTVVDNTAYAVGGMSFSTSIPACVDDNSAEVWRFEPKAKKGKKWKSEPSLKEARGYVAVAVDGQRMYAIGGDVNEAGTLVAQDTVESWKIGKNKWENKGYADLPMGCDETQAFAFDRGPLKGTITLAGCGQWPMTIVDVLQYDIKDNSWSTVGALNEARRNHAGENIGTAKKPKLFVLGGYNTDGSTTLSSSEIGTPGGAPFDGSGLVPPPSPEGVTGPVF